MTAVDAPERADAETIDDSPPAGDDFPFGLDETTPRGPKGRRHVPADFNWAEAIITVIVVAFLCGFVFKYLQPSKLFLNTTPSGGDMGAHVWQPAFLRDHILTHFRLTGWAPDWYAGFPSLVFYFPLPSLLIVLLSWIPFVPYNVAFKLVSVAGLITLPLAAYAFGKLAKFRFPGPLCLSAATLPYLFSTNFTIYGGNIASTMAGEFGFSLGLSAALVFLGLVARGLDTGRYRSLAAFMLAVTALCHALPAIVAVAGAVVLAAMRWDKRVWRWMAPVLGVGGCLAAFWALPFVFRLPYATNMGYGKVTQYYNNLFPNHELALFALAALGVLISIFRRQKVGIFLAIMAALSVVVFWFGWPLAPRLWNARVLPFWFLCLYLLAGVAVVEGAALLLEPLRPGPTPMWSRVSTLFVPVVAVLGVWVWVGFPLHGLPGGHVDPKTGKYSWLAFSTSDNSFIPDWVKWNYSGYQSSGKSREAEYFALIGTMKKLGQTDGCGRAMWEYEPELDQMGTPDALMLLPYWTDSCIGSMEGLYYESSATTPYHFVNASELSLAPSDPVRGLTYSPTPNVNEGVQHLQMLGVKYYMALTPQTQTQADADPDLKLVATSGPWPVNYTSGASQGVTSRTWKVYEVAQSALVTPLLNQPVVMKGTDKGGQAWLTASMDWYLNPSLWDVMYAASGPKSWARVSAKSTTPPRSTLQPVEVSNIRSDDSSVSFDVDATGVPVLVKVSYFPNWQAHGAQGPWRVAPNLMVVIPTSHHVWLHYGNTPLDWFGYLLGLVGLVALVWMVRMGPVSYAHDRRALGELPVQPMWWRGGDGDPYGPYGSGVPPPGWGPQGWGLQPGDQVPWGSGWGGTTQLPAVRASAEQQAAIDEANARLRDELAAGLDQRLPSNVDAATPDVFAEWYSFPAGATPAVFADPPTAPLSRLPGGDGHGPTADRPTSPVRRVSPDAGKDRVSDSASARAGGSDDGSDRAPRGPGGGKAGGALAGGAPAGDGQAGGAPAGDGQAGGAPAGGGPSGDGPSGGGPSGDGPSGDGPAGGPAERAPGPVGGTGKPGTGDPALDARQGQQPPLRGSGADRSRSWSGDRWAAPDPVDDDTVWFGPMEGGTKHIEGRDGTGGGAPGDDDDTGQNGPGGD